MRIAIPLTGGRLCRHFGHCENFALLDVDSGAGRIDTASQVEAPEHQPGLLPGWLAERGVTHVIAGNMGERARSLLAERSIHVVVGAPDGEAREIAEAYLSGTLVTGENGCDH